MNNSSEAAMMTMMNHDHHIMSSSPAAATGGNHSSGNSSHHVTMTSSDHSSMSGMMMQMTFYFGYKDVDILFSGIKVNSKSGMAAACVVVCVMAILYEGLKVLREALLKQSIQHRDQYLGACQQNGDVMIRAKPSVWRKMMNRHHLIQTLLHLLQVSVSYALMLIFMTYNAYLAISVLAGAVLGYFVFGWRKALVVDVNEHCH